MLQFILVLTCKKNKKYKKNKSNKDIYRYKHQKGNILLSRDCTVRIKQTSSSVNAQFHKSIIFSFFIFFFYFCLFVLAIKPLAKRTRKSTQVILRFVWPSTCVDFGRAQIWTQVDARFFFTVWSPSASQQKLFASNLLWKRINQEWYA